MRTLLVSLAAVLGGLFGGSAAAPATVPAVPAAQPTPAVKTVGPLFFPSVGGLSVLLHLPHFCTASVIDSSTRDLVVTAAHCVYGTGLTMEFAPGFHDGTAPYGAWVVRRAYVPAAWRKSHDPAADVAVLEVAPKVGRRLQDVVGGNPMGVPVAGLPVQLLGYPLGIGGHLLACVNQLYETKGYPSMDCTGLPDGVSGGPWFQGGHLVGVTGGLEQGGCGQTTYSAPIAATLPALVKRAESGAPSDLVPIGFLANVCGLG